MFTALSSSTLTLTSNILTQMSRDASALPAWFVAPSGLDSYLQVIEYADSEINFIETMIVMPHVSFEINSLPAPINMFHPKTELAKRLWAIRQKIVASGTPLLDWDGVAREVAERRGERG